MKTALALSPHLDDAAFSCGGLLALLVDAGWRVVMATAFTRSVADPGGFALECQLDKGLMPDVDYMALRREEDRAAAGHLGVETRWLELLEAPHRGYDSAAALFGPVRAEDAVVPELGDAIGKLFNELRPDLVLAPQGLGGHVDHRQLIRAVFDRVPLAPLSFWRDSPYVIRDPGAAADPLVPTAPETVVPIAAALDRKVAASCAYTTQLGFQFGGAGAAATALRSFAGREGSGAPAERFLGVVPVLS